jgi:hypothetical protein
MIGVESSWSPRVEDDQAMNSALAYLDFVQCFELEPGMVNLLQRERAIAYPWLVSQIDQVNQQLQTHLLACQECFFTENQRSVQIFAAPLNPCLKIDGFCDIRTNPITILVDPGRIEPRDWLGLVAHEYAHAITGTVGHSPKFAGILQHICIGLGLGLTSLELLTEKQLCSAPPCRQTPDPIAFWLGQQSR